MSQFPIRYPLTNLQELAGGARDGGLFRGPKTDTSALWKGRPPVNVDGIGPMGMGGKTTLLGVKVAARPRLPASYFVTVAYMCWACRRRGVRVTDGVVEWLGGR